MFLLYGECHIHIGESYWRVKHFCFKILVFAFDIAIFWNMGNMDIQLRCLIEFPYNSLLSFCI